MSRCAAEAIGTFALVFAGTGAIVINHVSQGAVTHVGIALTFGLVVMALIYAIGDVSGAHLNPAVTLGFWISGRFQARSVAPYVVSQAIGAIAASVLLRILFGDQPGVIDKVRLGATLPAFTAMQSFTLELLLTAFLMFVVLNVSSGSQEKGIMAGAAIGAVIALEAMFAGPICGASMNPIRSIAPAIVSGHLQHLWVYILAPCLGAAAGVLAFQCVREDSPIPVSQPSAEALP